MTVVPALRRTTNVLSCSVNRYMFFNRKRKVQKALSLFAPQARLTGKVCTCIDHGSRHKAVVKYYKEQNNGV